MNAGIIIFVVLLVLAFLGLPIYLSIGIATLVAMLQAGFPLEAIAQKTFLGMNSASLLCIPLFILAGNIMAQGITQKLIAAANVPLGRVRGSLASVTVLSSALFGAISGSAVATAAAVGGMTVPAMKENGYDKNYAVACASCSSLLGPMIPPSISLVIYASLTECSIQKLFMATAAPAVFCTVCFLAYTLYYGRKMKLPKQPKTTAREKLMVLKDSIWALFMPIIVLGLIFGGICTVSEAAAISALYSAIVGMFIYRTVSFKNLLNTLYETTISVSAIMILVGLSKASAYVVISSQLPQLFMETMTSVVSSKFVVLLMINIIFLILGCLMEGNCIIVMMVPPDAQPGQLLRH